MKKDINSKSPDAHKSSSYNRWTGFLLIACVLTLLVGLFFADNYSPTKSSTVQKQISREENSTKKAPNLRRVSSRSNPSAPLTAEQIVAAKVTQFAKNRRAIAQRIADRQQKEMPADVKAFFDAVEKGDWEEIQTRWEELAKRSGQYANHEASEGQRPYDKTGSPDELNPYWQAILDTYGVADQARKWPAQELLDYGHGVLDTLRPGMVYVGGTDNGRWIPELLNETNGGEPHVILTQNALADSRYTDWMQELYGDRFTTYSSEDSHRVFEEYVADARKRLEHDQQFPDEPKQVRPGEDLKLVDGQLQVGGQAAVMAINEKLLELLMSKNPDLSFAMQESFPLTGTYADALPLGPLMELGAQDTFTSERATQSLDYWRNQAQEVLNNPTAAESSSVRQSYSHDAVSAANLLAAHNFTTEAEQAYRIGIQLCPENPEPISGLVNMMAAAGRWDEARQVMDEFARHNPDRKDDLKQISATLQTLSEPQTDQP